MLSHDFFYLNWTILWQNVSSIIFKAGTIMCNIFNFSQLSIIQLWEKTGTLELNLQFCTIFGRGSETQFVEVCVLRIYHILTILYLFKKKRNFLHLVPFFKTLLMSWLFSNSKIRFYDFKKIESCAWFEIWEKNDEKSFSQNFLEYVTETCVHNNIYQTSCAFNVKE